MQPVLLPSASFYIAADREALRRAAERIEEQFADLLRNGAQAQGLPEGIFAAGQHLNPFSLNQRGLYGTAAALLVLARSSPSSARITLIEGLIRYVSGRPAIERSLPAADEDRAMLPGRLIVEERSAFKTAELLYALAAVPPAVVGREALLQKLMGRLQRGRNSAGGWSADLDSSGNHDALATASVVRSLHAAGVPVNSVDLEVLKQDAADTGTLNSYVRCFCLLVLLEVTGPDAESRKICSDLVDSLRLQLRDRTEANYEFTIGNRQHDIRIPWQLYLISCSVICNPSSIIFAADMRRGLLDCIQAVGSSEGYVYHSFGHMKSTRTYSILMDTLCRVDARLETSRYLLRTALVINWVTRVIYSRSAAWLALLAALSVAAAAIYAWLAGKSVAWEAVGPELAAAIVLAAISFLLSRVRSRRR